MKVIPVCLSSLFALSSLAAQSPMDIHATAQCESLKSDVLGIATLQICDIGVTNYSANTVTISEPMIREWFPTLQIENAARAHAVADKAFKNTWKSRGIAFLNYASPLAVALMGGGLISASIKTVAAVSLANTGAQAFKSYLVGQQPSELAFLPTLPMTFTLTPYGKQGFSVEYTVFGSIAFTSSPVVESSRKGLRLGGEQRLIWEGTLPGLPVTHDQ